MKHILKSKGLILTALACGALFTAHPANALDCPDYLSLEEQIKVADAFFEGHVTKIEYNPAIQSTDVWKWFHRTTIIVDKAYKGVNVGDTVMLVRSVHPMYARSEQKDWSPKDGEKEKGIFALPKADKEAQKRLNLEKGIYYLQMCDVPYWDLTPENLKLVPTQ